MDFLNKAYAQLTELFRTMTPAGRITTGLLLAVVVMSLVFLFRQQTDKADEYLFGAEVLTQGEVSALEAAFSTAGLSGWDSTGNRVRVPRSQRHTYLAAAAEENAIPASFHSPFQTLLSQSNWMDNRETQKLKAMYANEQFLEQTLRKLQNIEEAKVKISERKGNGFPPKTERQALVAVKALGSKRLVDEQVATIRSTVAGGADVDDSNVTVTDLNGNSYPGAGKRGGVTAYDNVYASYLRDNINLYRQNISDALLSMYPGVRVAVNVELEKELRSETTSYKYDDKSTPLELNTFTKENTLKSGAPGGRPGAAANGVASNTSAQISAAESSSESTSKESREDRKDVVGATQTVTQKAPLSPLRITAAIGIPTSYFLKVWRQQNPPVKGEQPKSPAPEELKRIETETINSIEEIVRRVLPQRPKGDDADDPITVVTFTETPPPLEAEPSFASTMGGWFAENWRTVGLFLLAAGGVVFLRGMIRAAQNAPLSDPASVRDTASAPMNTADHSDEPDEDESGEGAASTLKRRFQGSGRSLRDELTDLVREDPDAAANILKLWISDAA